MIDNFGILFPERTTADSNSPVTKSAFLPDNGKDAMMFFNAFVPGASKEKSSKTTIEPSAAFAERAENLANRLTFLFKLTV